MWGRVRSRKRVNVDMRRRMRKMRIDNVTRWRMRIEDGVGWRSEGW